MLVAALRAMSVAVLCMLVVPVCNLSVSVLVRFVMLVVPVCSLSVAVLLRFVMLVVPVLLVARVGRATAVTIVMAMLRGYFIMIVVVSMLLARLVESADQGARGDAEADL